MKNITKKINSCVMEIRFHPEDDFTLFSVIRGPGSIIPFTGQRSFGFLYDIARLVHIDSINRAKMIRL